MKLTKIVLAGMIVCLSGLLLQAANAEPLDDQVADLLKQMTLEEKVGQMTQVTVEVLAAKNEDENDQSVTLDPKKLREAVCDYHVGSILNCGGSANTVENWQEMITAIQDVATKETRLKIPVIYGVDSIHGANYITGATIFPQNFAMAATGNVNLVRQASAITAAETRAAGIPWNFNPVLGLARQPLWSRFYETFGEDAYIASTMGAAYVEEQQGDDPAADDRLAACMKHYLGYSYPRSGKDRTPAWIPDREIRERFVKPFEAAVEAGVLTCMINSSEINGVPVHASKYYLTDLLRGELGFTGFTVSDWNDINNLYQREKVAVDQREAVKMAVLAGVDMSMVPYDYSFYTHLLDLVQTGEVPMERIDEAVSRILRVKFQVGIMQDAYPNPQLLSQVGTSESTAINLAAAQECITLLKNSDAILPLDKDAKVLVTGPTANSLRVLNGGWTITWQGDQEALYPAEKPTVLEAIKTAVGQGRCDYAPGTEFDSPVDIGAAAEAARTADVAIICLGEATYCETPGNIDELLLPQAQRDLVKAIAATETPIVLVLIEGRPRIIAPIVDDVDAIVMAYLPGMEGGQAIADVLFGDANPSGKLPFTYPKHAGDLVWYDHKHSEAYHPQWPFGHGLSYTSFQYSELWLSMSTLIGTTDGIEVRVRVENTGSRAGQEIVQLYLQDEVASVTPSVRRLKGFKKVALDAGEAQTVSFSLTPADFQFIGLDHQPVIEPGRFQVMIGNQQQAFEIR